MEFERPHRSGTSSSELFICFTSRPSFSSSSSMKLSSKPILSPGRSDKCREPTLSFSSSLNRRLGSMKGGQSSPMFKKRGCGMENAEPTSPKVTCIGQVRVKTKKQGKKMMNLRKRENPQGGILQEKKEEECLPHRNQKWVHLPLTICETLRGFGSEFNCFLPCGGNGKSCSSRGRGGKRRTMSSCGAVFAKWLMALQEGEEEKRREMRVVVGEEEGKGDKGDGFDEIEEEKRKIKEEIEEYEEGRYSICIPPKNALLLMRCRSEPLRMSALANRFWDSSIQDEDDDEEEEGDSEDEENEEKEVEEIKLGMEEDESDQLSEERVTEEADDKSPLGGECDSAEIGEDGENPVGEECYLECLNTVDEEIVLKEEDQGRSFNEEIRVSGEWGLGELFGEEEKCVTENNPLMEQWSSAKVDEEQCVASESMEDEDFDDEQEYTPIEEEIRKCIEELVLRKGEEDDEEIKEQALEVDEEGSVVDIAVKTEQEEEEMKKKVEEEDSSKERGGLPDCLLMMMFEPKLSMEVSKETWVCGTDFAKPRSRKQVVVQETKDGDKKKSEGNDRAKEQNQKSSVLSMTSMIEQRLMNAAAYEPFVLTRCKSEPLRSSAKLMIPDACFWKNRQLEAPPGVGF